LLSTPSFPALVLVAVGLLVLLVALAVLVAVTVLVAVVVAVVLALEEVPLEQWNPLKDQL
jgi:hypothetical protein